MGNSHHSTWGAILGATAAGLYPSVQEGVLMGNSDHSTWDAILGATAAGLYSSL